MVEKSTGPKLVNIIVWQAQATRFIVITRSTARLMCKFVFVTRIRGPVCTVPVNKDILSSSGSLWPLALYRPTDYPFI